MNDSSVIVELLETAGVEVRGNPRAALENWLGLSTATTSNDNDPSRESLQFNYSLYEGLTAEDLPLDPRVDVLFVKLCCNAYDPSSVGEDSTSLDPYNFRNPFFLGKNEGILSLEETLESVRVTRYLRAAIELNTTLKKGQIEESPSASHSFLERFLHISSYNLVHAFFIHLQQLPALQSQMHLYTSFLLNHNVPKLLDNDPKERLLHYEKVNRIANHLEQEWNAHVQRLEYILGEMYRLGKVSRRIEIRQELGRLWNQFNQTHGTAAVGSAGLRSQNTQAAAIPISLNVLLRILRGINQQETQPVPALEHLLYHSLLPLHQTDAIILWRDQTSLLELYHEPLTQCVAILLQQDPTSSSIPNFIAKLLNSDIFPSSRNTSKQVLLLHEIDTFLTLIPPEAVSILLRKNTQHSWWNKLITILGQCMSSAHSRVAERALAFFRNERFVQLVQNQLEYTTRVLIQALVGSGKEPSWNPTVRKLTYNVLSKLQSYDEDVFRSVCNASYTDHPLTSTREKNLEISQTKIVSKNADLTGDTAAVKDFSLKAGMGSWRPPTSKTSVSNSVALSMPPPRKRGSMGPPARKPLSVPVTTSTIGSTSGKTSPPLTVTGVAPWAMINQSPLLNIAPSTCTPNSLPKLEESDDDFDGYSYVAKYMQMLKPPEEEEGTSSWSRVQMAETPTLLPNLKFHNLVFGHDLGKGAFGVVRYARHIDRTKTRSQWAEYAVKVISTEKIKEMGYESSVRREIAVLSVLSHPGIARLVSSFRFHDGAYLVLEYASKGDLHTVLQRNGSLDIDSTRFIIGETVAAIASIHELGLVYGDLKPENMVITELGHVKLTDFGACRPVTKEAESLIGSLSKDVLKNLRDGDWKNKESNNDSDTMSIDGSVNSATMEEAETDILGDRIEGTTAYLPPEVILGAIPTQAADSWALGCVFYQCLTGRPPLLDESDQSTKDKIVAFQCSEEENTEERIFQGKHAEGIDQDCKNLIRRLLQRHYASRPTMNAISQDNFFNGMDVFNLHRNAAHEIDVGKVSPQPDAKWARRQFSSIWAPMPGAYDVSLESAEGDFLESSTTTSSAIPEGGERNSYFTPAQTKQAWRPPLSS